MSKKLKSKRKVRVLDERILEWALAIDILTCEDVKSVIVDNRKHSN